jgi:hypothetical protein
VEGVHICLSREREEKLVFRISLTLAGKKGSAGRKNSKKKRRKGDHNRKDPRLGDLGEVTSTRMRGKE